MIYSNLETGIFYCRLHQNLQNFHGREENESFKSILAYVLNLQCLFFKSVFQSIKVLVKVAQ